MKFVKAQEILKVKTGKYDANHAVANGRYKFFTCAMEASNAETYSFDDEVLILPGNGANVGEVMYHYGKLEAYQRTYVLHEITENVRYLLYYFKKDWVKQITKKQVGSATNYIKLDDILSFQIPLPPLSIQKAIAEKLDKADALRKKDKELLAQYDELAQAIFIDMFGDPVRNEKGWKTHKAKTIFNFSSGKFNPTKNLDASYAFPTYGGNGITGFSSSFLIDFPTIVIGRVGAYCGSIHITDEKSWITDNAIYIKRIPKEVNLVFLYFFLINYKLNRFADYSGQPKITQKPLEDIDFFIVDINLQNQFAEKIKNIEAQKAIVKQQAQQSEDLFQALLQESFNFN